MEKKELIQKRFELLLIIFIFIILFIVIINTPIIVKYKNTGNLVINEIMSSNTNTIKDFNNQYSDYIEIYNGNDYDIDLTGYYLTNNSNNLTKYKFPDDTIIKSKSYMVVVMSGANKIIDGEIHTNFELTNDDSIVILSDKYHNIINQVIINKLSNNISYGLYENSWHYYNYPTIGYKNTSNYPQFYNKLIKNIKKCQKSVK